jgi:transposase
MGYGKKYFKGTVLDRKNRRFSEEFKLQKVAEIIAKKSTVLDICKAYEVSDSAVYRWLYLYSSTPKPERTIVESKSDTTKILAYQKKIAELERLIGQKQVIIDFQDKVIDLAEQTYKVDIKKKFISKP